jgi:hypothetical protein
MALQLCHCPQIDACHYGITGKATARMDGGRLHAPGAADRIQHELDVRRNVEPIENMKQVVVDCMLAPPTFLGDLSVLKAHRYETSHIFFPHGQQLHSVCVHCPHERQFGRRLDSFHKFSVTSPYLPSVGILHASAVP